MHTAKPSLTGSVRRVQAGEGEANGEGAVEAAAGAPQPEGPGGSLPGLAEIMFLELVPQVWFPLCTRVPVSPRCQSGKSSIVVGAACRAWRSLCSWEVCLHSCSYCNKAARDCLRFVILGGKRHGAEVVWEGRAGAWLPSSPVVLDRLVKRNLRALRPVDTAWLLAC